MNKLSTRVAKAAGTTLNANKVSSIALNTPRIRSYEEIPGPKVYPIVGSLFSLKGYGGDLDMLTFDKLLFQLNERYGDLVKMDLFGRKFVFAFKPEHAKIIFQNEGSKPNRPSLTPWTLYADRKKYSLSLINSQGEEWKKQRSASNQIVAKPRTVASYLSQHNSITDEFIQVLKTKFTDSNQILFDKFETQLKQLILEMMSVVAFDYRIECINEKEASEEAIKLFDAIPKYSIYTAELFYGLPLWKYYRTAKWIQFEETSDFIYDFTRKYVMEAYEKMKNKKQADQIGTTMLEQFYLNQEKFKLTLGDIVSMMSEFLIASFDTTAITLHYLLSELGTHTDIQEEIYREIKAAYPQNGYIDADFFSKIPLLKASLKESQRLHNFAPNSSRALDVDIILDNYIVPKGSILNIGQINMCYSEKYYKNAKAFNPKRWLKGNQNDHIDPYTSLPFGFGSRMCIGRRLAEQKMYLILTKLIKNYKIECQSEKKPDVFRLIKVPGSNLKLKLTPRVD